MDEAWIVFLAGSISSFGLMMLVYFRIVAPRGAQRALIRRDVRYGSANPHFLEFLREEAVARVNDNLVSIVAERRKGVLVSAQREAEQGIAARLAESRQTLQSLFSTELVAAYDKVVVALDGRHPAASDAMTLVTEFRSTMAGYLKKRSSLAGEPATSS